MVSSQKTANSLVWSAIENGSLAVISLVSLVVYSRLLSQAEFGLFSIVSAIVELFGILVLMLFHDALVQRRDVTDLHFDTAFSVTVFVSVLLMVLCWLAGPVFQHATGQRGASHVLAAMGLVFPLMAASATIVAQQRREFAFKSLAIRSLFGRVLGGVIGIVAAFLGAGIWSLVVQQLVTTLVGSVVLWITGRRAPRLAFGLRELRQLVSFGAFSVGALFLSFSIKRLFTIVAGLGLGVTVAGYLNISFRVVDVLWAVSATAVSQVSLPMLANLQSDPARMKTAFKRAVEFACLTLYPCFIGIAVTAPEIVDTVFGHRWMPAVPVVVALACLVLAQAPRLFVSPVFTAIGRPRDILLGAIAELLFMLILLGLFRLPSLGWAVGVWVASECVQIPITTWLLRRATSYGVRDQFDGVRTPLLASVALAVAVLFARSVLPPGLASTERLAALIPIGGLVYIGAIALLNRPLAASFLGFVRSAFDKLEA